MLRNRKGLSSYKAKWNPAMHGKPTNIGMPPVGRTGR